MGYRQVYFRIKSGYEAYSGWAKDNAEAQFRTETRSLFQEAGWTIHPGGDGVCDTVAKGRQELYLHPMNFTTLFVDGNHENFDKLNALPIQEWHGGKVHEIRPHILHLIRGQVFDIEGYTFFTMGGAASHDIWDGILDPASPTFEEDYWLKRRTRQVFRVKGVSWWEQEMPSESEYAEAVRNLERVGYKVDYIITHCAPTSVQQKLNPDFTPDPLTDFLEKVKGKTDYHYWLFGHYHDNRAVDEKHILLWEQMVQVV